MSSRPVITAEDGRKALMFYRSLGIPIEDIIESAGRDFASKIESFTEDSHIARAMNLISAMNELSNMINTAIYQHMGDRKLKFDNNTLVNHATTTCLITTGYATHLSQYRNIFDFLAWMESTDRNRE